MGHPPIPFPTANVPILGAICQFHDVQPDVTISCTCDGAFADRLIRFKMWGQVAKCRACGRHLAITKMVFDAKSQQVHIEVKPVVPRDLADSGLDGPPEGSKPS